MTSKTTIGEREKGRAMQKSIRQQSRHSLVTRSTAASSPKPDTQLLPNRLHTATATGPAGEFQLLASNPLKPPGSFQ